MCRSLKPEPLNAVVEDIGLIQASIEAGICDLFCCEVASAEIVWERIGARGVRGLGAIVGFMSCFLVELA